MRILIQRVDSAQVSVDEVCSGSIQKGLLVFLGIHKTDTERRADELINKLIHLRIFSDEKGKMNYSLLDIGAEVLVVSQFTLYGDCSSGRRPDFFQAAPPDMAKLLYLYFIEQLKKHVTKVQTGIFGAHMMVSLKNNGPVTFILDSKDI